MDVIKELTAGQLKTDVPEILIAGEIFSFNFTQCLILHILS